MITHPHHHHHRHHHHQQQQHHRRRRHGRRWRGRCNRRRQLLLSVPCEYLTSIL